MATAEIPTVVLGAKLEGEALVYSVTFDDLADGATITAHTVTSSNGTVDTSDVSGQTVRARISGGTAGDTIRALYSATGSDGQTPKCWVLIPVLAAP